ncbi:hypothetical protein [Actinomadura rayongensis]|uniref:Uncharacterized protein n=1 Tax=Actinomadura rayongensis TaxID=1429076 RepID=A0A6I4WAV6_9ACTN|nr:hypothetical protein [Actinomadura rayongensis]MXQ67327.1 hypothetical protein [Actinomadura rayongensis]
MAELHDRPDLGGIADTALAAVTAEDAADLLRSLPDIGRRTLLQIVGLGGTRKITIRTAQAFLRVMRGGDPQRRDALRGWLDSFALHGFASNGDELSAADCADLLGTGAESVLRRARWLRSAPCWTLPDALLAWSLARTVEADRPLAVVALGLLATTDNPPARAAWRAVRSHVPELPEDPVAVGVLRDLVRRGAHPNEESPYTMTNDPEAIAAALAGLRPRFGPAADAASRTADLLRALRAPDPADLAVVQRLAADFEAARADVGRLTGEDAEPDLTALLERVDGLRADLTTRPLAGLAGPEAAAALVTEIRRMSAGPDARRLVALAELLRARAREDLALLPDLANRARAELPGRLAAIVDFALLGQLTLDEADARPAPGPPPDEADTRPAPPPDETAEPEDAADDLAELDEIIAATAPARRPDDERPQPAKEPEAPPVAEPAPAEPPRADRAAEAEIAALTAGRPGLAGWIRTAAGRPAHEHDARRCAALARDVVRFAGPLSGEFTAAARSLDAKKLADDPAGGLLAWAAGIRVNLVNPTPDSTRLVETLNVLVSDHPELRACGEAFLQAARDGVYLGPGLDGWIRGVAGSAEARREAAADAARMLEVEPLRKIKYQRATEVWKALLQKDGPIGSLLAVAAEDDAARAEEAAAEVARLRAAGEADRLIDEAHGRILGFRPVRQSKQNKRIIAGARTQLLRGIDASLATVGEWAEAARDAAVEPTGNDWRTGPLYRLREAVGGRRAEIEAAFTALADAADPLTGAAAVAAGRLVGHALDLLDGMPRASAEPPVAHLLNGDLLLAGGLALEPGTLEPRATPELDTLCDLALAEPGWDAAFEERARRLDHEGTAAIVRVVAERGDEATAVRLADRRAELVEEACSERDTRVEETRDLVAEWVRDGLLTEDQARRAEERLGALSVDDRIDFDRVRTELDALRAELTEHRDVALDVERVRLEKVDDRIGAADAVRIRERIDAGDLTVAREFLAQLEAGNKLHEPTEGVDHFRRFFPAFPAAFAGRLAGGGRARNAEGNEYITALRSALTAGSDVTDPGLAGVLAGAEIRIPGLRGASRQVASEGLRHWRTCRHGRKSAGNLRSSIDAILKMVGLEARQTEAGSAPDRLWIDLEEVRHFRSALLPAFGSRMSPSGNRLRLLLVWRSPGPQQLVELLKGQPEGQTVLILYFGVLSDGDREQLAGEARRRPAPTAGVLDDAAIGYLACVPEDWSATVAIMAPFTATNPYAPSGDVPDEMFYGRDDQLRAVIDRGGSSVVYGGRQLGKSALLRKAERHICDTDPARTVILENIQTVGKVPANSLWPRLGERLAQAGVVRPGLTRRGPIIEAVRSWATDDADRQLLILLDEADRFLNQDADNARFEDVTALRDLMSDTGRRVKVVFAGLHQTARFQSLPNQPLAHLGTPIAVGPLEPQSAFNLLVRPFAALGFVFPETLAARVIAEANNAPALVQLFAEHLLTRLRRDPATVRDLPYVISREDVLAVWLDKKLAEGFRDRFEWTLNLDKRYKVIAYTVALHALANGADTELSVRDLWEQCHVFWARGFENCTNDGFRGLLDECVNLGVLSVDGDRYHLRTPHILNLLGGVHQVEEVLENAGRFEMPDEFDAHSYRAAYKKGPERSPLTSDQLARLLRPRVVHLVVGSRALHVERVAAALKDEETARSELRVLHVRQGGLTLQGALSRAGRHDGHNLIVLDVPENRDADHFGRRLQDARATVAEFRNGTLSMVLVVGPALAPAWVRASARDDVSLTRLRRFDASAVRQWMWEDSQEFTDEAGQEALLARTGGWPTLIGRVVTRITEGDDREQALERCRDELRQHPGALLDDVGVTADPALRSAWRLLVSLGGAETPDDLAGLLALYAEDSVPDLTAGPLGELGYGRINDVVEALRVLGALVPEDGKLVCEPVLAEATRRAEAR